MAARVVVGESVAMPYEYYRDNVAKSLELFDQLQRLGKPRVVFSSSASVYAERAESSRCSRTRRPTPAPRTRGPNAMMEMVLQDLAAATGLRALILRYFNPIGADPGPPARNPRPGAVATCWASWCWRHRGGATPSRSPARTTRPGTAPGCGTTSTSGTWPWPMSARSSGSTRCWPRCGAPSVIINLGTGQGVTVRELVDGVESVLGQPVPVREVPRRPGDVTGAYANVDRARELLGWTARPSLGDGVDSAFRLGGEAQAGARLRLTVNRRRPRTVSESFLAHRNATAAGRTEEVPWSGGVDVLAC